MSELQSGTGFNQRERELVRSALRRYMQEHRIGTPALQYRIIEADQPRRREIPLSTLQRFVTGSHHTQDHHVALCHAFVRELPYYGEGRDLAQFGDALAAFFALRWPEPQGSDVAGPQRYCGRYSGTTHPKFRLGDERIFTGQDAFVVPYSEMIFSRDGESAYLRVEETILNAGLDYPFSQGQTQATYSYEGVFVAFGPMLRLMLRNNLTRQPRLYELEEYERGVLLGRGHEAPFVGSGTQGRNFNVDDLACRLVPEGRPGQ
jgi:hypothetical protein